MLRAAKPTRRRTSLTRDVVPVAIIVVWLAVAFWFHDTYYDAYAVIASAVILGGAIAFYRWDPSLGREGYRLLGFFVCGQAFLSSGLSVLNRVDINSLLGTPTTEAFSFAVESAVIFALMFLLGAWTTAPRTGKFLPDPPTSNSGPVPMVSLVLAALTAVVGAVSFSSPLGSLGTLPLILVNIGIVGPMLIAQPLITGRRTNLAVAVLLVGQASVVFFNSMLGVLILPMRDMLLARVYLKKRLPILFMTIMTVIVIVLNPVKHIYRDAVMHDETTRDFGGTLDVWSDAVTTTWSGKGHSKADRSAGLESNSARLDYNWISAHVYRTVPRALPFEMGGTYAPIATILIPRIFYPDKPDSAEYARGKWMIKLGVQTESGIKSASFALPAPAEAYWNFGWAGVFLVPAALGACVGLMLRWGPKDPVIRVAYIVLLATRLGQFLDMLIWVVTAFVSVVASGAFAALYARIGKKRPTKATARPVPSPATNTPASPVAAE